jgi:hypothetical protein
MKAKEMLVSGANLIDERGKTRDNGEERSMGACVRAFNAVFNTELTETQGWFFMVLLKMSRSKGGEHSDDDYVDGAAYFALAGESDDNER